MARKAKSPIVEVCEELIDQLQGIVADVKRLSTTPPDKASWGPFEQRFSLVRSALWNAEHTLDKLSPQRKRGDEDEGEDLPLLAGKKPLAIEFKP